MTRLGLAVWCLLLLLNYAYSSLVPTNAELMQSIAENVSKEIVTKISQHSQDSSIVLSIEEHPFKQFFEYFLVKEFSTNGFRLFSSGKEGTALLKVNLFISNFDISYSPLLSSSDSLARKLQLSVTGIVRNSHGELFSISSSQISKDNISVDAIDWIEKDGVPFKGKSPETKLNFLERYIEPIIVVTASALIVILFFTIRSY